MRQLQHKNKQPGQYLFYLQVGSLGNKTAGIITVQQQRTTCVNIFPTMCSSSMAPARTHYYIKTHWHAHSEHV